VLVVALSCPDAAAGDEVEMVPRAGAEYHVDDIPRGRIGGIVLNAVHYEFKLLARPGKHIDLIARSEAAERPEDSGITPHAIHMSDDNGIARLSRRGPRIIPEDAGLVG